MGWRSAVGAPLIVEGRGWGVVGIGSTTDRPLPVDTEGRLAEFSELVATAVANAESHEELTRLGEEQAALRRVATLVAEGAPPAEVFEAVSAEVGRLIPADAAGLGRYETDGMVTTLSGWTSTGAITPASGRASRARAAPWPDWSSRHGDPGGSTTMQQGRLHTPRPTRRVGARR
jgi:GAF domain-containing protein